MKEWHERLQKLDIFQGLTYEEMKPLLLQANVRTYKPKEMIFVEGEKRTHLFVLKKGIILITKMNEEGEERVINILTEGEIFPHIGFFDERPYPGTAFVKTEAEVFCLPIKAFEKLLKQNPELTFRIIKMMSKKIYDLQQKLNEHLSFNVEERLIAAIKKMNEFKENKVPLTHQDLANIVGASRETVSRLLKKMEKEGKIIVRKNVIEIC